MPSTVTHIARTKRTGFGYTFRIDPSEHGLCGAIHPPYISDPKIVGKYKPVGRWCKRCLAVWKEDREKEAVAKLREGLDAGDWPCVYIFNGCAHPIPCRAAGKCMGNPRR